MEHTINSLLSYSMEATDGVIGEVKEFYFDDQTWDIRYLIVKTGGWLSGREVLISPAALVKANYQNGLFPVGLTTKQISDSPDIDTDKPVSRQQETELFEHYAWEGYWLSGFYPGGYLGVSIPFPVTDENPAVKDDENNSHLRSTSNVNGYHIQATDGEIGHINDLIMDDKTWQIKCMVIDTHNWFGGKKVLIDVKHIKKIVWEDSWVFLDVNMAFIEKSNVFNEMEFNVPENVDTIKVHLPIIPNEIQ